MKEKAKNPNLTVSISLEKIEEKDDGQCKMSMKMLVEDCDGNCLQPIELSTEQLAMLGIAAKGLTDIVTETFELASIAEQGAEEAGLRIQ